MQKIIFIWVLILFSAGCSVIRKKESRNQELSNGITRPKLSESIKNQNITANNFFIPRVEFKISNKEGTIKLLGSIKFKKPDKYLISLKSIAGIEAARVFITKDTVLINDRINRKQYCCSAQYSKRKYGITASVIPVILGDFINDNLDSNNPTECSNGKLNVDGIIDGIRIKYVIDCKKGKSILAVHEKSMNEGRIEIEYSDFLKSEDLKIPGKIEIKDFQRMTTIGIRIQKIEYPWNGNIEFIPGSRYEIIKLQ